MKYCPYCGAAIIGGAVSFCAECGNEIQPQEEDGPVEPIKARKPKRQPKKARKKSRKDVKDPMPEPVDDGYDGYYNDVQPIDSGRIHDRMDPELIKRIIIIAAGAVVLIIFSILLIFLL